MKKAFAFFTLFVFLVSTSKIVLGMVIPSSHNEMLNHPRIFPEDIMKKIVSLSPREFEKATGRHLNFKERIIYRLLQTKLRLQFKHPDNPAMNPKAENQAQLSLIFGIGAFVVGILGGLLPFIGILSIPLAIAAIVYGAISVKKVQHKGKAIWGMILGGSYLFLLLIAIIVLVSVYTLH